MASITVEITISETGETQAQILKRLKNNPGDVHDSVCKEDFRSDSYPWEKRMEVNESTKKRNKI